MSTQQQLTGNWNQLKGMVKQRWGQLTDDELQQVEGNYDQLVGLVQQKTGQARQQIERVLNELNEQSSGMLQSAVGTARQYASQASESARGATHQLRRQASARFDEAQEMVYEHPAESIAVAFGTGLLVGMVIGIVVGSRA
jgi:uncharacterized protein YjbJ (UPF0337 family)